MIRLSKQPRGELSSGLLIYCITPLKFHESTNKIRSNFERVCLMRFHIFVIVVFTGFDNALQISTIWFNHFEIIIEQFSWRHALQRNLSPPNVSYCSYIKGNYLTLSTMIQSNHNLHIKKNDPVVLILSLVIFENYRGIV